MHMHDNSCSSSMLVSPEALSSMYSFLGHCFNEVSFHCFNVQFPRSISTTVEKGRCYNSTMTLITEMTEKFTLAGPSLEVSGIIKFTQDCSSKI